MENYTPQATKNEEIKLLKKQNRKLTAILVFLIILTIPTIISMFLFSSMVTAFIGAITNLRF